MKKILIIEDDEIAASVYRNKLSSEGYQVEVAEDGEEGLREIGAFKPDLVLLDLVIPKIPGVELLKLVRANPEHKDLPVVVFSNTFLSSVIKDAWKAGASKCLSKSSSTPKQVIEAIRNLLADSPATQKITTTTTTTETPPKSSSHPAPTKAAAHPAAATQPANAEETQAFLKRLQIQLPMLRNGLHILPKKTDDRTRADQLEKMLTVAHGLAGASVVGLSVMGQFADAFEALLKELYDHRQSLNISTLRTLASSVDFLDFLAKQGVAAERSRGVPPRILVVDDELLSRRAITHALERAKLTCTDVEEPLNALKLLQDNTYDLIFLDADMPGMNGFELCAKLRAIPAHQKTPVVFVTGLTDLEARANSSMAGANDFIAKPFPFIELAVKALIYVLRSRLEPKK